MKRAYKIQIRDGVLFQRYEANLFRFYNILWLFPTWVLVKQVNGKWSTVSWTIIAWKKEYDIADKNVEDFTS